jgi:hypothetical protein
MPVQCRQCDAGPVGIGGHDHLFVHSFAGDDITLRCQACDSSWVRKHTGAKIFLWSLIEPGEMPAGEKLYPGAS